MIYIIIVLCILFLIAGAIYIYKESTGFVVTEIDYTCNKIKKDKIKIAFLSDLHNMQYGEKNIDLYKKIEDYNPDFIIFAGDMVTSHMERDYSRYSDTLDFIQDLSKKWKIYYGIGNHEEHFRREENKFPGMFLDINHRLSKMGAPLLCDEKVFLSEYGITIYGLDLEHKYYRRLIRRKLEKGYLENKFGKVDEENLSILIAHNPEHFDDYESWTPDLILSGHVHGGIIRLPILGGVISPGLHLFPRYDGGVFSKNKTTMILSRGIGTHTIPIRINNKAEIIFLNIRK